MKKYSEDDYDDETDEDYVDENDDYSDEDDGYFNFSDDPNEEQEPITQEMEEIDGDLYDFLREETYPRIYD